MAVASIEIECANCGKLHTWKTVKYNRREANSWESWAQNQAHLCPECYREEMRKEEADAFEKLNAEVHFPEIEGVSEKQISYAAFLRSHFCAKSFNAARIRDMADAIQRVNTMPADELAKYEEKVGAVGKDAVLRAISEKGLHDGVFYTVLVESSARVLIDTLKYRN